MFNLYDSKIVSKKADTTNPSIYKGTLYHIIMLVLSPNSIQENLAE